MVLKWTFRGACSKNLCKDMYSLKCECISCLWSAQTVVEMSFAMLTKTALTSQAVSSCS